MTFSSPPWNAGLKRYIVKRREYVKSPIRRVWKFTPWAYVDYATTLKDARMAVERAKSRGGIYDYAIFYGGRRVDSAPEGT